MLQFSFLTQAKKGKRPAARSIKLKNSFIEEHIETLDPAREDPEERQLWGEIAATTELIAEFLSCTPIWEALEVRAEPYHIEKNLHTIKIPTDVCRVHANLIIAISQSRSQPRCRGALYCSGPF